MDDDEEAALFWFCLWAQRNTTSELVSIRRRQSGVRLDLVLYVPSRVSHLVRPSPDRNRNGSSPGTIKTKTIRATFSPGNYAKIQLSIGEERIRLSVVYLEWLNYRQSISISAKDDAVAARGWILSVFPKLQELVWLLCTMATLIFLIFLFTNFAGCHRREHKCFLLHSMMACYYHCF